MTDRTRLSVFITTYNNGRTLTACLESIKWADEIVVLDSFSTDDTLAIAQQYGAQMSQHEFMGYGPQNAWRWRRPLIIGYCCWTLMKRYRQRSRPRSASCWRRDQVQTVTKFRVRSRCSGGCTTRQLA